MTRTYTVTIDGELKDKDAEKIRLALQKALGKWFKAGHEISVSEK